MVLDMAADGRSAVKMVVSYGGEIVRCSGIGKARYAGGENRIVRVGMSERLRELRARLAALAGYSDVRIRYALAGPGGDGLDNLHDVADDHNLWVLVTRLCCCEGLSARDGRARAFLSPVEALSLLAVAPDRIRRRASSPLPLDGSKEKAASTLPRALSAIALYSPAASPLTLQVDVGFEALAEIAAAQRSTPIEYAASSFVKSSGGAGHPMGRADGGFNVLAAIPAAQHRSATATSVAQADSGFEALAAVAAEQTMGQGPPPAAPMFLVPVALTTVFFRAIPVYGCFGPAAVRA